MKQLKTILFLLLFTNSVFCAKQFTWKFNDNDLFKITVRANYKIYKNNKYLGLNSKELKGVFRVITVNSEKVMISGEVYQIEKTIRGTMVLPNQVNQIQKSTFYFNKNGQLLEKDGTLFPPIQGFPYFTDELIEKEDIYSGNGFFNMPLFEERENKNIPITFNVQYKGESNLNGEIYDLFEQFFNINFKSEDDKIYRGRHNVKMFFDDYSGRPIYMDDRFEDQVQDDSGDIINYKGFYLYFYNRINSLPKKAIVNNIKIENEDGFVKETENGISITLNNLHFLADSTEIVETDVFILESVYNSIKEIKDRTFLIVGHTADTGNPEAEMKLSQDRALSIAEYFQNKGIRQDKILFTGKGAKEPIAPNDSEENRRKNRRVEIIILED